MRGIFSKWIQHMKAQTLVYLGRAGLLFVDHKPTCSFFFLLFALRFH